MTGMFRLFLPTHIPTLQLSMRLIILCKSYGTVPQGFQKLIIHVMQHRLSAKMSISIELSYYFASRLINLRLINFINCANLKLAIVFHSVEFCTKRASG